MSYYLIFSYIIGIGLFIETTHDISVSWKNILTFLFSPFVVPIVVGMKLAE